MLPPKHQKVLWIPQAHYTHGHLLVVNIIHAAIESILTMHHVSVLQKFANVVVAGAASNV